MSALVLRPFLAVASKSPDRGRERASAARRPEGVAAEPPLDPGEARRFREVLLPHLDAAYGFARLLTRDPTAAEDLAQEAYLKAYRSFRGYRGGDAKAWLFAILRTSFISEARRGRGFTELAEADAADQVADPGETPEAALVREGDGAAVRAAVEALPDPFREAIVLREVEEMSYRQIADVTATPIGTVMSRLARARRLLAAALAGKDHR